MTYTKRITKEELEILKNCVDENKSITIMMVKTNLTRQTILNSLRKHFGISRKDAENLGK